MATTTEDWRAVRTWTTVGDELGIDRAELERAIDAVAWCRWGRETSWPAVPGLAIEHLIRELRIPKVGRAGISEVVLGGEEEYYALYGIEGRYTNGVARVFVVDRGTVLTPVCSELER